MKILYLLRHAKSSWDNPDLDDFDRPLNKRGEKDAPKMGKRLKKREVVPDIFLSSPAARAIATAKMIAQAIDFPLSNIQSSETLYHATEESLLHILRSIPEKADVVIITGHNPGLTNFANLLQDELIDNVPTAGIAAIRFKVRSWNDVQSKSGKLIFFDYPKK
jgi:phosphohistidine phosphatase